MADKMMRIAGRGSDGTAKPIKTDLEGNIGVYPIGNISECRRLGISVTVPANGDFSIEVPVSTIIDDLKAKNIFNMFELSFLSAQFGEGVSIRVIHHRESANLGYDSRTVECNLNLENGIIKADGSTYYISNLGAQVIKNRFITIQFVNSTSSDIGIYYPTMVLK